VVGELPGEPPSFQERPAIVELAEFFATGHQVPVVCAIIGARGVGKTHVAAAYARRQVLEGFPVVAWISGDATENLVRGLADLACALEVSDPEDDSAASARRLRAELETRIQPTLLVIDNAIDGDNIRPFMPATGHARVIITSTDAGFAQFGHAMEVSVFDRPQSLDFLRERSGRDDDDAAANQIADELGDLPLALEQVASVMAMQRLSYSECLDRLRFLPAARMLCRSPGDPYPLGAAEAILMSRQSAVAGDPNHLGDRVLAMISVLSPAGVRLRAAALPYPNRSRQCRPRFNRRL